MLEILSPLITAVDRVVVYGVTPKDGDGRAWEIRAERASEGVDLSASRYQGSGPAEGSKRKALRTGAASPAGRP